MSKSVIFLSNTGKFKKVTMSNMAVFCSNLFSTYTPAKHQDILHTFSCNRWLVRTIHSTASLYFPWPTTMAWDKETPQNMPYFWPKHYQNIHLLAKKGSFNNFNEKNYSTKLRDAFPNCLKIYYKSKIWNRIFEHLER